MVIKAAEYKIRRFTEGVKVIGAFYLIHEPGRRNIAFLICFKISGSFYMVGHEKSKQQE